MATTYLREFIQRVSSCSEVDSLGCLFQRFMQEECDLIIITDESDRPLRVVRLGHWLAYCAQFANPVLSSSQPSSFSYLDIDEVVLGHDLHSQQERVWLASLFLDGHMSLPLDETMAIQSVLGDVFEGRISRSSDESDPQLLMSSPVAIAPDHWRLMEFRDHVQQLDCLPDEDVVWVVVDQHGASLGMLDECAAWRSLVVDDQVAPSLSPSSLPVGNTHASQAASHHLLSQFDPTNSTIDQTLNTAVHVASLAITDSDELLTNVIENLPLPVMIQTADGRVVMQNTTWQRHINQFQNLDTIQQQLAGLFAHTSSMGDAQFTATQLLCELGNDSNECVCTCSMADGNDRVWKFTKVPLAPFARTQLFCPLPPESYQSVQSAIASSSAIHDWERFQLAQLGERAQPQPDSGLSQRSSTPLQSLMDGNQPPERLWLVIAQDITVHHQLTQVLTAQNENLEQSNHLKDEFLNCITHELKTPLTSMLGLSSLLKDHSIGTLNERQTQYAQLIYKSGRQLVSLVNNILDLTRIEAGDFQLTVDVIDIQNVCGQAYKEALELHNVDQESLASRHDDTKPSVVFTLNIQPGLRQMVADPLRLKQMLVQLLSNAMKFSYFRGTVALQVGRWESWLAFTVTDTGVGIPADKQHLIFQKFQHIEHPLTHALEGTGLGLALVKKLAELHGGDISFTSEEGVGSQFMLLLPEVPHGNGDRPHQDNQEPHHHAHHTSSHQQPAQADQGAIAHASDLSPSFRHQGLAIVVEAEPSLVGTIIQHLKHLDFRVVVARSGTDALGKIRRLRPDVVLLDLAVPLPSGFDVLMLLKADPSTCRIPVITMSATADMARASSLGADGQLDYPIRLAKLKRSLKQLHLPPHETQHAPKPITLLYLNPALTPRGSYLINPPTPQTAQPGRHEHLSSSLTQPALSTENLNTLLHPLHCRVLEVDDVSQADLLSRVWNPNVILLSNTITDYEACLAILSQSTQLSSVPIITLTLEHTKAANREKGLNVFPCLNFNAGIPQEQDSKAGVSPLVEVIQIAAGVQRSPRFVICRVVDQGHTVEASVEQMRDVGDETAHARDLSPSTQAHGSWQEKRLVASVQYFQAAGIQASIVTGLDAIIPSLERQPIDLLLLYYPQASHNLDGLTQHLRAIREIDALPIVVWADDDLNPSHRLDHTLNDSMAALFQSLNVEFICGVLPMNDVLSAVNAAIAKGHSK